ncbi:MAG TPA: response regulator transcription factor [Pyrinomonadaceae bacterium]|jgi:Response regulator containing a CheY-like receiver domain and an HTH DNA-binding domain|nr:response regulator transcription factor [Pyrinomonadaceae bacterium]
MKKARILLADTQMLLMDALAKVLEPEFEVVGKVPDGRALLKAAVDLKPDIVVLDISMPRLNGLDAGRRLKETSPAIKLIYLATNQDADIIDATFRMGATAYLLKNCNASDLLNAVRGALLRPSYLSPFVIRSKSGMDSFQRDPARRRNPLRLTGRQRQVLQLLVEGRTMKEVALVLEIKPRTVAYHKYRIMDDFNLDSNAALIRFGERKQVVLESTKLLEDYGSLAAT